MAGQPNAAPLVSVVIPAYLRPELLRKAVGSAIAQDLEPDQFEVLVVDSSPDERNRQMVTALEGVGKCTLSYYWKQPEGPGPSRNLGAQHARGTYVAFLDSDCVASPGWLRAGLATFQSEVGLVQGRTLPDPAGKPGIFKYYVSIEQETFLYETANMFYRRHALLDAGGFGSDLTPRAVHPMGGEDVRLAWTVKRAGWRSAFSPGAVVFHAVLDMPAWRWVLNKRLFIFPGLIRDIPELRRFFFWRYFYDREQAALLLALAGIAAACTWLPAALLSLWYLGSRSSEPTRTLRGPLRLLRAFIYLPRDLTSLLILLAGSWHYRRVLL